MSRNVRWGVPGNRWDQPTKHSTLVTARVITVSANADITPDTVVAQAFIDTPSVTADANITPTTVVAQVFIDTPAVTADANITPTTVTAQAFVDTPTVTAIRTVKLATAIHRPRLVQKPRLGSRLVRKARIGVVSADANVTPTTVVATAFIDTPSVTGDANVTPTTVTAQAFVDTPVVTGDANITAGNVVATTTIDGVTVTTTKNVKVVSRSDRKRIAQGPQTKVRSRVLQGRVPVVSADASVTPDTVVATAFIDAPAVSTGRAAKIAAARDRKLKVQGPQLRKRSATTPIFPGVAVTDANVTAGDVAATISIPTPSVEAGRILGQTIAAVQPAAPPLRARLRSRRIQGRALRNTSVTPATVTAQAFIDTPTVTGDANVTPTTVVAQAFVDTPGISVAGDASLTAGAVVTEAFIPTPTVTGNADVTPTTIAAVVSVPTPALENDVAITLTTVVAQATVPTPSIYATPPGYADVVPDTVVAVVNMDALPFVEPGGLIRHRGLIGYGYSNSSPFGNRRP